MSREISMLAAAAGVYLALGSPATAAWSVRALDGHASGSPEISGSRIARMGFDGDHEIYLHDLVDNSTVKVTDNSTGDRYPQISGSRVVWEAAGSRIRVYDAVDGSTTTLATGSGNNWNNWPQIGGPYVVWEKQLGYNFDYKEIYLHDGSSTRRLTHNSYEDDVPKVDGQHVVWRGKKGGHFQIFLYNVNTESTVQVTNSGWGHNTPQISGATVVWYGHNGTDTEIFAYDIPSQQTTQITNNSVPDSSAVVSGPKVAWSGWDGNDAEIFLYDIQTGLTTQITDNDRRDTHPCVSGDLVVWQSHGDVFVNDGTATTQLSLPNSHSNEYPNIDGRVIGWIGYTDEGPRAFVAIPEVNVDIRPGGWPNPLNPRSRGVLPLAICGSDEFDVMTIDPETILLGDALGPLRWSYEDVATPFEGEPCEGHDLNGDGFMDLTLKFRTQELVSVLGLDLLPGETVPLALSGALMDGTPLTGSDCVWVLTPGDGNRDGQVDGLDYVGWSNNYMTGATGGEGDSNDDGVVDGLDYVAWSSNYDAGYDLGAPVPEPASAAVLLLGWVVLLRRKGRDE